GMSTRTKPEMRTLVTTSWDDGHPLDMRTAELLKSYGVTGTFYVTTGPVKRRQLALSELRALADMGMEIGSHTLTHPILPRLEKNTIFQELDGRKKQLEDLLGREVTSLS